MYVIGTKVGKLIITNIMADSNHKYFSLTWTIIVFKLYLKGLIGIMTQILNFHKKIQPFNNNFLLKN